ncbi:MAG TPA: extracellular solute-binding protein [Stellaceae bacterium]|nr:extracellular solute-binding protein [Stellaceae bacterium]
MKRQLLRSVIVVGLIYGGGLQKAAAEPAKVLGYSAIFQDNYTEMVLNPFNAKGADKAEYVGEVGSAQMLGQLRSQKEDPQLDIVIMDTSVAAVACAEGLVDKLTLEMLPVMADLDPQARAAAGECGPAVTFDNFVIAYDTKAVNPPPTSLQVLWDPAWRGRLSISAPPDIQGLALTAILANADTGDWQKPDGAFAKLRELAPSVQTFNPQPDAYTLVLNGTVTFATGWNARGQLYHDRSDGRIGVMVPREGTVRQINTINLVKGAHNRAAALAFMAYALSPEAQKAFTERMFYAPTNPHARIDPAAAGRIVSDTTPDAKLVPVDWTQMVKLREIWNQRWRRDVISAGAH